MTEGYREEDFLIFTKAELELTIKDIKELVNEFEKEGKKIDDYFDEDFVSAVRTNDFNTDPASLDVFKKYKTRLQNRVLINKIEKTNYYLEKMLKNGSHNKKEDLGNIIEILIMLINKINSTNESEKYFKSEEYIKFFNKTYYTIKVYIMNGFESKLTNFYTEINTNKEIVKIFNSLITKEIKLIEKSRDVETEDFNRFATYYLSHPINENELIDKEILKRMFKCFNKDSLDTLNEKLDYNIENLTDTNIRLQNLLSEEIEKKSLVNTFTETTKPNHSKEVKKKLISLFLSGLLSLGIAFGIEEISYNSIQKEYKEITNTEEKIENKNARIISILFGLVCALLAAYSKDLGVFGIIDKLQKLNDKYDFEKEYNEKLIKEITEIKKELKPLLESEQETLNSVYNLLDEILITANENDVMTSGIKKLTKDASYNIERTKKVLNI